MSGRPFDDLPVLGSLPRADAVAKLHELGEHAAADAAEAARTEPAHFGLSDLLPFRECHFQHTAHGIGFLPTGDSGATPRVPGGRSDIAAKR